MDVVIPAAAQLGDDRVQALALDELHDVIGQPVCLADTEDRHDVGVVQLGRRLRLTLETTLGPGIDQHLLGQHVVEDATADRRKDDAPVPLLVVAGRKRLTEVDVILTSAPGGAPVMAAIVNAASRSTSACSAMSDS